MTSYNVLEYPSTNQYNTPFPPGHAQTRVIHCESRALDPQSKGDPHIISHYRFHHNPCHSPAVGCRYRISLGTIFGTLSIECAVHCIFFSRPETGLSDVIWGTGGRRKRERDQILEKRETRAFLSLFHSFFRSFYFVWGVLFFFYQV